jgi:hypothetical protein
VVRVEGELHIAPQGANVEPVVVSHGAVFPYREVRGHAAIRSLAVQQEIHSPTEGDLLLPLYEWEAVLLLI